jgi:molybdopterin converting factor small subunit
MACTLVFECDACGEQDISDPLVGGHNELNVRIGYPEGWQDVDRSLRLAQGSTLADLITAADAAGIPLSHALAHSPHLRHTLMLNGERCPVSEADRRTLADGDQVYLLAPLAGG